MLQITLAIFSLFFFFYFILFGKNSTNKNYIKFIFLFYPLQALDIIPSVFSTSLFVVISLIYLLFFYKKEPFKFPGQIKYVWMTSSLLLVVIIGLCLAKELRMDSVSQLLTLLAIIFFSRILITECTSEPDFVSRVVKYLQIGFFLSLIFLTAQLIFGPGITIAKSQNINVSGGLAIRYPSFFQDPQKYAQYLAVLSFLFLLPRKNEYYRYSLKYLFVLIAIIAVFLTGGRSATGGWLLGIFIMFIFSGTTYRMAGVIIAFFAMFIAYAYADYFALFQRTSTVGDAYDFRFEIWTDAWKIFLEHPIFGIGIGNYANYVSLHNPDQFWISDNEVTYFDHPESGYLKLLTELGITGFFLHMAIIVMPMIDSIRCYIHDRKISYLIPVVAVTSWFVAFYTVYSLGDVRIYILVASLVSLMIADSANKNSLRPVAQG